eukprot:TRINITY_DN108818_c0_g1_i1.p1 TRINITY_DN108818_c0_g1~~TRINITY_DN108818_c0_g1_i1.p1  ORF type:complete len:376 (-),score=79.10 TRINITY_DN108818_c0_g1_i1:102-1229(-)
MADLQAGKGGTFYTPFPVLGLASHGDIFLTGGGGGSTASKEVPNTVQAHRYDEETHKLNCIAALNTEKQVVVGITYSSAKDLWFASLGPGTKVLKLSVEENTLEEVVSWTTETEGKFPCQNVARCSPDGEVVATGGSDGVVKIYKAGKLREEPTLLHTCAKNKEVNEIDFDSTSKLVASCDDSGACRLWDVSTGEQKVCISYQHAGANLNVKIARFIPALTEGGPELLVTTMSAPRGPGCLGLYGTDGKLIKEVKVDAKPMTCLAVDSSGRRACLNMVTGGKRIYDLASLSCIKKVENCHELPAPCGAFIGEATAISGSGDRTLHFMDTKKQSMMGGALLYMLALLLTALIVAFMALRIGVKGAALGQGQGNSEL